MIEYKEKSYSFLWQFLNRNINFLKARLGISRKVLVLPAPALSGTVTTTVSGPETIITFSGVLPAAFTLDVQAVNCNVGDKLYVIVTNTLVGDIVVTESGNIVWNACGATSSPTPLDASTGTTIVPLMFDGTNFYGLEYC